jgi:hypothetical protein
VSLHELGHDLVFALQLGLELLDLVEVGIFDGLGLAAVLEEGMAVLEEFFLPAIKEGWGDTEFIADGGDGTPSRRWRLRAAIFSWGVR